MLKWAVTLAESAAEQNDGLHLRDAEYDNLRTALGHGDDPELTARVAVALGRLWERRGLWGDGRSHVRDLGGDRVVRA